MMPAPEVAQVGVAGGAPAALAAGRDEGQHDVVAGGDAGDARADLLDDAGALVAADDREGDGDVAGDEVGVGVAQPGGGQLDEDLLLLGRVELDLLDAPLLAEAPQHGGLDLHTSVLSLIIFS